MARAHGAQTVLINLEPHDDGYAYDEVYIGLASESVRHWVREFMLEHGGIEAADDRSRSVALEENIRNFIDGEAYRSAVEDDYSIRADAESLLQWLGVSARNPTAKFELDVVVRELLSLSWNSGEGGDRALVVHDISHRNDVRHLRDELVNKNIEYAADLIAWSVATRDGTHTWGEPSRADVP